MSKPVYVNLFGKFLISQNDNELSESKLKTNQLTTLLTYMVYNSDKHLSIDSLYSVLWPDENSDNPAHALRNLIYRARTLLKQTFGSNEAYITTLENNCYCWNKKLDTICDIVQFENHIKIASDQNTKKEDQIENYLKADELYGGDFLVSLSNQDWVIPISTYYRHKYTVASKKLTELLLEDGRFDDALRICLKSTEIDPFDEKTHKNIINIYNKLGQDDLAVKHYQYISKLFYRELGVKLSKETTDLYKEITAVGNSIELDIQAVQKTLSENDDLDIPLFCDYDTLKYFYSLQIRSLKRKNDSQFLLLITLSTKAGKTPLKPVLHKEMPLLVDTLKHCLRKNDIVASYSESQFLIMLSSLSHENVEMVKNRIDRRFSKNKRQTLTSYSIVEIA